MANLEVVSPRRSTLRPWSSRWKAPSLMLLGVLVGVGFGLGHHAYYQSFNGTIVESTSQQTWTIRIGTGLAFLTKSAFTAVIGIAFAQYLWVIARKKPLSLDSLDAMFAMTSNPTSFFDFGVLSRAKLLTLVGIVSWLIPLIATVTPATLTVETRVTTNTTRFPVQYPNFILPKESLWGDYMGAQNLNAASPAITRLLMAVSSGMSIIPVPAPSTNSSYSIQFYGPCLKCQYLNDALRSNDFNNFKDIFMNNDTSLLQLWRDFDKDRQGIYYKAQALAGRNVILIATAPTDNSGDTRYGSNITCQLRNASYTVDFRFTSGSQSNIITNLAYEPVLSYSTYQTIPYLPQNGARAYLTTFLALSNLLQAQVGFPNQQSSGGMTGASTPFVTTGLLSCPEIIDAWKASVQSRNPNSPVPPLNETTWPTMCRNNSLPRAVEDLSHNFTLSLLSVGTFSITRPVDVQSSFPMNYYLYQPMALAISYLAALGVALTCFAIGTWACVANGHSGSTSFSTIMHTTRNPQLDEIFKAGRLGGEEGKTALGKMKLRYGVVGTVGEGEWEAFGRTEEEVRLIGGRK